MFDQLLFYASSVQWGLSVFLVLFSLILLNMAIPEDDRDYMDPLPYWLRMCWPLVRIFAYYIGSNLSIEYLTRLEDRLEKTGVNYLLTAEQFVGLRITSAIFQMLGAIVIMDVMQEHDLIWPLVGLVFGYFFPEIWLNDTHKRRKQDVIKALPVYLDFITMSVEAGLNFTGAMNQAIAKAPRGALHNEFSIVMRDVRSGFARAEALKRMSDRLGIQEINAFVRSVVQAEKMGSSLKKTLQIQSEQRRNERFQRAEKMAMEAPIKLVGPLILFIFPVTFIVLGFPIVMKFLAEGIV